MSVKRFVICTVAVAALTGSFLAGALAGAPLARWLHGSPLARDAARALGLVGPSSTRPSTGSWKRLRPRVDATQVSEDELAALDALGYLAGYRVPDTTEGVTRYDPERAAPGLNLYVSGHAPEAILMEMDGTVVHRWQMPFERAFPRRRADETSRQKRGTTWWRRVHLFDNGDVAAVYPGWGGVAEPYPDPPFGGLIRLDKDSKLLWAIPEVFHHDLDVDEDGSIYGIASVVRKLPALRAEGLVIDDEVVIVSPSGEILRRLSIIDAFERSPYASVLSSSHQSPDPLHTNTLEILDGSQVVHSEHFGEGNLLISLRNLNTIAILDPDTGTIVWALSGQWTRQHQPTLLPSGRILLFDNLGNAGMSKVMEVDPFTQEIVWAYEGDTQNGFVTTTGGSAMRLPGGNTLIVESNGGRAFEVNAQKQTVWEFVNPARAGEEQELVATLFDLTRLPEHAADAWLP